jgi:hypothetical protein
MAPSKKTKVKKPPQISDKKITVIVILSMVIFGLACVMQVINKSGNAIPSTNTTNESLQTGFTKENVTVLKTNLSKSAGTSKVPAGLPNDIPIETANVTESYTAIYPDKGFTQYTISFITSRTVALTLSDYSSYMKKAGYTMMANIGSNKVHNYLYGTKNNNDLSVVVNLSNGKTVVQLAYLKRK